MLYELYEIVRTFQGVDKLRAHVCSVQRKENQNESTRKQSVSSASFQGLRVDVQYALR